MIDVNAMLSFVVIVFIVFAFLFLLFFIVKES